MSSFPTVAEIRARRSTLLAKWTSEEDATLAACLPVWLTRLHTEIGRVVENRSNPVEPQMTISCEELAAIVRDIRPRQSVLTPADIRAIKTTVEANGSGFSVSTASGHVSGCGCDAGWSGGCTIYLVISWTWQ